MSHRITAVLLMLSFCVPGMARVEPGRKKPSTSPKLLRDCVASFFFGGNSTVDAKVPPDLDTEQRKEWLTWRATAVRAERIFRSMSGTELRSALMPLLGQTRLGSATNVSVAYVLAMNDIDRHGNIHRMLRFYDSPRPIISTALDTSVRNWNWGPVGDSLPGNLANIYRHSRDPFVLRRLFAIRTDGVFAEMQDDAMTRLLYEYTPDVLRVAAETPEALRKMIGAVEDGVVGPPHGLKPHLQTIARGRDPKMAKAARELLAAMAKYSDD